MRASKASIIAVTVWFCIFIVGAFLDAHAAQRVMQMKSSSNCSNYVNIAAVLAEKDGSVASIDHTFSKQVIIYYHDRTYVSMVCSGSVMYVNSGEM